MAKEIKRRIREATQLTASAGVSYNKFLAKLASDRNKPDGLCLILPEQGKGIIAELPIGGFHGIGSCRSKARESSPNCPSAVFTASARPQKPK